MWLTVLSKLPSKNNHSMVRVKCHCGSELEIRSDSKRKSCGCMGDGRMKATHGMERTPTYRSWECMKQRCLNPNHIAYKRYAGKGITICDTWRNSFTAFLSDMGVRPEGMTLDRIDNTKGYNAMNCKWATPKEQANNRSPRKVA